MTAEKNMPESNMSTASELPAYDNEFVASSSFDEKARHGNECNHNPSQTPRLDAFLRQAFVRQQLQTVAQALMDATSDDACTRCAAESGTKAFTDLAAQAKKAKKEGKFTKEDKKAVKQEMKGMMKELKVDAKKRWRGMAAE